MTDKDKREGWLRELKEGDKVIVSARYYTQIKTVEKITPTGMINVDGNRYDSSGTRRIDSYTFIRLKQWTQEEENSILRENKFGNMCRILSETKWNSCNYELIEQIYNLVKSK